MTRAFALIAFFTSAAFAPWALTVGAAVFLVATLRARVSVILGGALMDALYSVPVPALGGFAYFYTALFALLVATDLVVRARMID
jgi:hypothetical protein